MKKCNRKELVIKAIKLLAFSAKAIWDEQTFLEIQYNCNYVYSQVIYFYYRNSIYNCEENTNKQFLFIRLIRQLPKLNELT